MTDENAVRRGRAVLRRRRDPGRGWLRRPLRGPALVLGLAVVAMGCSLTESSRLGDELRTDPLLGPELGVPGFEAGQIDTHKDPLGGIRVTVERTFRGPRVPVQQVLEERAAYAGWVHVRVSCHERTFRLSASRYLGERAASLGVTVRDEKGGVRRVSIEVSANVEGRTSLSRAPDEPPERCAADG